MRYVVVTPEDQPDTYLVYYVVVASGFRCKWDGRGSGFMVMLGDGTDNFGAVTVLCGGDGA
jgi:hypothetical protein